MPLTSEAKKLLSETIRGTHQSPEKGLRARLLQAIHDEADRRYRFSVSIGSAGLDEAHRTRRARLEAWIDERARASKPKNATEFKAAKDRFRAQAEKETAATLINRLVLLRHLEALGLSRPAVLTGGWNSKGYREFREFAPALCKNSATDATEGYSTLLHLVFDELAIDLPGLFGDVGLTSLFPIPAAMLRDVVERLDDRGLESAWTDDTTLGWVYQYWNDPDREALDEKINAGGKIEPYEIASKTQMFTERYMVEWLLQNSLGLTWLCMCRKRGWTPDAKQVLPVLEARRAEWRARREACEVALDELMPIESEVENHWKYYVPQPIPDDAVANAPASIRDLKILDPACGSGHFLVIAFDLLTALYREEARHRGETIVDREIAESILENNLFGIDIDPRAIQIAAAGLYLKARSLARAARPKRVNLVAPMLQLGNLPPADPAVAHLRQDLKREVGIPEELTNKLLMALAGVDYLGSLLKVDAAVEDALRELDLEFETVGGQGDIFRGFPAEQIKLSIGEAKATVLDKLEMFLAKHSKSEDLGLRLDGEQVAAGVRFVRMAREGTYDVVVGNPPYQRLSRTESFGYVPNAYRQGKADLYAAFLQRALQMSRQAGTSALVTMRGWMFLDQFRELREHLLSTFDLRALVDLDSGAFEAVSAAQVVLSVACLTFMKARPIQTAVALRPTPVDDKTSAGMILRKRAGLLAQVGRYEFDPQGFEAIEGEPIVYWWNKEFLKQYAEAPKLGGSSPARVGMKTSNNSRFVRRHFELHPVLDLERLRVGSDAEGEAPQAWVPYVQGPSGRAWYEPLEEIVEWRSNGLSIKVTLDEAYGMPPQAERWYFRGGVAFAPIGARFTARLHRYRSIFSTTGTSLFPTDSAATVCLLNATRSRQILESLNPGTHFEVRDVNRVPIFEIAGAAEIVSTLEGAFAEHEAGREQSAEFVSPRSSRWRYSQQWAQCAVDRPAGALLPPYEPDFDPPDSQAFISFALGVALGRFGANGEGVIVERSSRELASAVLFVSMESFDSLNYEVCLPIHVAWKDYCAAVGDSDDLRTYLRKSFFGYHKKLYENRAVYFPLSSAKRSFVAFVSIHRWQDDTLKTLLADHLVPSKRRLQGELEDLRTASRSGDNKGRAEKRLAEVQKLLEELHEFIAKVTAIAEQGPPPPDDKTPKREIDARYVIDLDDGVMVNSAALWPLLEPQWKDPKKWWKELATAQGKKDYDWSHLAARYFPTRVQKKCHADPSLAVAHKCFWELHPTKAYAWELRLQDEIGSEFTIDEPGADAARAKFLAEHEREAAEILAHEMKRRERKAAKVDEESEAASLFDHEVDEPAESADD